jgi:hypothetical protein
MSYRPTYYGGDLQPVVPETGSNKRKVCYGRELRLTPEDARKLAANLIGAAETAEAMARPAGTTQ